MVDQPVTVTVGSDVVVATAQVTVSGEVVEPPVDATRGPSPHRLAPGTGPYGRPATKYARSQSELLTVLAQCVSDDVLEYSGPDLSGTVNLSAGNAAWPKNVLVRPPIGQWRISNGLLQIEGSHVTVAGFDVRGNARPWAQTKSFERSGFWRCRGTAFIGPRADNGHSGDAFIVDFISDGARLDGNDRAQASTNNGGKLKVLLDGVTLGGAYRAAGSTAHTDTFQVQYGSGGGRIDAYFRNSVFYPSYNAALFVNTGASQGTMEADNVWAGKCGTHQWPPKPAGYDCGGYYAFGVAGIVTVTNSDFDGRLGSGEKSTITATDCRIASLGPGVTLKGNSTVGGTIPGPPPVPTNLDWMVAA